MMVWYLVFMIIGNAFQHTPSFYNILFISILAVFFSKRTINIVFVKQYSFIIGLALYGIGVAIVTGGGIGGPLTIVTGLMVCYATQNMQFDRRDILLLVFVMCVSIVYWLYRSPTYYSEFFYNHWKGDGTYMNANGVGHYLCYEYAFMFIILSMVKKKWVKYVKWGLALACLWGCYNVRARMALATLVVFLIANLVVEKFPKHKEIIIKIFLLGSIALEIIFPIIYLWMYNSKIGSKIAMFGLAEKGLYSGRQDIWQRAFDVMTSIPAILFGIGSKHNFWEGHVLNMHNNAMNLYVVIGLIGLVFYFGYLVYYIFRTFNFKSATTFQWQCLVFFICIVFEGTTDITLFYNEFLAFYFMPLGIALSRNYEFKEQNRNEIKKF